MTHSSRIKFLLLTLSVGALAACSTEPDKQLTPPQAGEPVALLQGGTITKTFIPLAEPVPVVTADELPAKTVPDFIPPVTVATPVAAPTLEERVAKLEKSVSTMRADYDKIMPAFATLNTTNERIATLIETLEKQNGKAAPEKAPAAKKADAKPAGKSKSKAITPSSKPGKAASPAPAAEAKPEQKTSEAPVSAPAKTLPNTVNGVRLGEHNGKTRLVLDLKTNSKPAFKTDLDNTEKLLLIDLADTGWAGADAGKTPKSGFVAGWGTQTSPEGGSSLAVQLKSKAKILSTQFLPAEGKDPARLVFDIGAAK